MGVIAWDPVGGWFFSGKYRRGAVTGKGRLSGANPFGNSKFTDRNWTILEAVEQVAAELGRPVAQVALAWTLLRKGVSSTLVGASKVSQLESNIAAVNIHLDGTHLNRLNQASAPPPGFSSSLASPMIRRMVYGGHEVVGWDDSR